MQQDEKLEHPRFNVLPSSACISVQIHVVYSETASSFLGDVFLLHEGVEKTACRRVRRDWVGSLSTVFRGLGVRNLCRLVVRIQGRCFEGFQNISLILFRDRHNDDSVPGDRQGRRSQTSGTALISQDSAAVGRSRPC